MHRSLSDSPSAQQDERRRWGNCLKVRRLKSTSTSALRNHEGFQICAYMKAIRFLLKYVFSLNECGLILFVSVVSTSACASFYSVNSSFLVLTLTATVRSYGAHMATTPGPQPGPTLVCGAGPCLIKAGGH